MSEKVRVLFVCLGNICRSPMAEAYFRDLVSKEGLAERIDVTSCGTGDWHIGNPPHEGTQAILTQKGIGFEGVHAKTMDRDQTLSHDYIVAMDRSNVKDLVAAGVPRERIRLLTDFINNPEVVDVPDPYFHHNFDYVYELIEAGSKGILDTIKAEKGWA